MRHSLKTWPIYFRAIEDGTKRFEIRKNDRDYKVGDVLDLQEWDPNTKRYTGNDSQQVVTYIASGIFGMNPEYVVMSIQEKL